MLSEIVLLSFRLVVAVQPASQPQGPAQLIPIVLSNQSGLNDPADADKALDGPFMAGGGDFEVTVGAKKRQLKTCRDFLAVANLADLDAGPQVDQNAFWRSGAYCFALSAIKAVKPAKSTYVDWFRFSPKDIPKLPPTMDITPSPDAYEDAMKASRACQPWGNYDPSLKIRQGKKPDRAGIRTDGWTGELIFYGRGDFNNDGLEDLLLMRSGQVRGGSLADSTVFVVTQTAPKSCLRIVRTLPAPSD